MLDTPTIEAHFQSAIVSMIESPYGMTFINLDLTVSELTALHALCIENQIDYHQYGCIDSTADQVKPYLNMIGNQQESILKKTALIIEKIAQAVVIASKKETGWVYLRSTLPTSEFNLSRWHFDGPHYPLSKNAKEMQYKFGMTLKGAHTLFYPIHRSEKSLRDSIWIQMNNREWTNKICNKDLILTLTDGQAVFFLIGHPKYAALHAEPPTQGERLFLAVVPCSESELKAMSINNKKYYTPQCFIRNQNGS